MATKKSRRVRRKTSIDRKSSKPSPGIRKKTTAARKRQPTKPAARKTKRDTVSRKRVASVSRDRKPAKRSDVPRGGEKHTGAKGRAKKKYPRPIKPSHVQWKPKERRSKSARSLSAKKGWLTRLHNQRMREIEERYARREREYQKNVRKEAKTLAAREKDIVSRERKMHVRIEKAVKKATTEAEKDVERNLEIVNRLWEAQMKGMFDETAYDIAEEYDMEPNEVYTIWAYNGASD